MIYPIHPVTIPQNKRKEINEKILYLIDTDLECNISRSDVFNAYTGDGGLHGLSSKDYVNYHEYSEAKKEIEIGQFFTPHQLCKLLVDCIRPNQSDLIADLTCGMGNFFNYLPNLSNVYGNEIDLKALKVAKYLYPQANLQCEDIRQYNPDVTFDVILGNPPFNLKWKVGKSDRSSQMYYCEKAHSLLKPGGLLALIVPLSFLSDEFIQAGDIKEMESRFDFIAQFSLAVDTFRDVGVDSFPTKIMFFRKKSEHLQAKQLETLQEEITISDCNAEMIFHCYIQPIMQEKTRLRAKLLYEGIQEAGGNDFLYKVTKLLYDIKHNPKLRDKHGRCAELVEKYLTQTKPDQMSYEEWQLKRLTKNKVLGQLNQTVRNQHIKEDHAIRLVKTNYGLRLKAYSHKTKLQLAKYEGAKQATFSDMVLHDHYPFENEQYRSLFKRKRASYLHQDQNYKEMLGDPEIDRYCDTYSLTKYEAQNGMLFELIQLNEQQRKDLRLLFQKQMGILNWQQGSGKTIAGMFWFKRLLNEQKIRNVFIVSAALAINLTWEPVLSDYREDFIKITSLKDIQAIKDGQIVIVTSDMLIKYQKQIRKYVRMQSQKVALLYDESDELTNYRSKRTRAALNCFRKVKYKLLTTGTTTRNNIVEIYPQLELLYNNSVNMICESQWLNKRDKDGNLEEVHNPFYMKPFPAYRGVEIFKQSFSPHKVTVFGVKKHNQDIYNVDSLIKLIDKTILTRKFKEIVGEDKYQTITHRINQNPNEIQVYQTIIEDFYEIVSRYYKNTGNDRKESMLRIIRQIQLLIKATSIPHLMKEYRGSEPPQKFNHIAEMVRSFANDKVAIGTVFRAAASAYHRFLADAFPDREIFLIDGEIAFGKRKQIIHAFEATDNGVLISTQQSLKSSVNIPSCNKIIIESMQWNIPKIEQYGRQMMSA